MASKYNQIFKPETMKTLDAKSKESLRQLLGDKNITQTIMSSQRLLGEIIAAERDYVDELEEAAVHMAKDMYPVIDYAGIQIEAKIVPMSMFENMDNYKRRVINGITQGASIRGAYGFHLFREYIDQINPALVDKYKAVLHNSFGIYDSDEAVAMMLQLLAMGHKDQGGRSSVSWDNGEPLKESQGQFIKVKAEAICFPMLLHEIIKGLHEILSLQGFNTGTKDSNQAIVNQEDKLEAEPMDLRYGKFIYDAFNELYIESDIEDNRVRELFLAELYKMSSPDFIEFIENLVNGQLTPAQKNYAIREMQAIERDLKKDDTGLQDLD